MVCPAYDLFGKDWRPAISLAEVLFGSTSPVDNETFQMLHKRRGPSVCGGGWHISCVVDSWCFDTSKRLSKYPHQRRAILHLKNTLPQYLGLCYAGPR